MVSIDHLWTVNQVLQSHSACTIKCVNSFTWMCLLHLKNLSPGYYKLYCFFGVVSSKAKKKFEIHCGYIFYFSNAFFEPWKCALHLQRRSSSSKSPKSEHPVFIRHIYYPLNIWQMAHQCDSTKNTHSFICSRSSLSLYPGWRQNGGWGRGADHEEGVCATMRPLDHFSATPENNSQVSQRKKGVVK